MAEGYNSLISFIHKKEESYQKAIQQLNQKDKSVPSLLFFSIAEGMKKSLTGSTIKFLETPTEDIMFLIIAIRTGYDIEKITSYSDLINTIYKRRVIKDFKSLNSFEIDFFEWVCKGDSYLEKVENEITGEICLTPEEKKKFNNEMSILITKEEREILFDIEEKIKLFSDLYSIAFLKYKVVQTDNDTIKAFFDNLKNRKDLKDPVLCQSLRKDYDQLIKEIDEYIELSKQRQKSTKENFRRTRGMIGGIISKLKSQGPHFIVRQEIDVLGLEKVLEEEELDSFLMLVINSNQEYLCPLIREVEDKLQKNEVSPIEKYLLNHNFSLKNFTKEQREKLKQYGSIEEIEEILPFLLESPFNELLGKSDYLVDLLIGTTKNKLETIRDFYDKAILRTTFIKEHPEIWVKEEKECTTYRPQYNSSLSLLTENLNLFSKERIDTQNLFAKELLLYPTLNLKNTIGILKKYYGMSFKANESDGSLKILQNPGLLDLIDQYLEIGLFEYAKENPRLIDTSKMRSKNEEEDYDLLVERYLCYQMFGFSPINKNGRLETIIGSGNGFSLDKEELLSNLYPDATSLIPKKHMEKLKNGNRTTIQTKTLKNTAIVELDETCKIDDLRYKIGDTIISRPKVLRNFDCLRRGLKDEKESSILLSSIYYHMYLSYDQQQEIINQVQGKVYKKQ